MLTDQKVKALKPKEKQYKVSDEKGLYLLVKTNGGIFWRLIYRLAGKEKNLALGVYPDISLKQARIDRDEAKKLILSAISNWQVKNEGVRIEDSHLFVKQIFVDSGRMLKRLQTAPQGRAYRIRKRSNHVTVVLDSVNQNES